MMIPRLVFLIFVGIVSPTNVRADETGDAFFEKRIRPVLVKHCYTCHSGAAEKKKVLKGKLRLDSRAGLLRGGENGAIVVPGKPEASPLMAALNYDNLEMPPGGKLPSRIRADFSKWIKMGAPIPKKHSQGNISKPHWAFQPRQPFKPPKVNDKQWPADQLDRFILARLEQRQLRPARAANRTTWLRRVTFDLTGLRPTPAQIDRFLSDKSQHAHRSVVDQLLRSPHFGVHWGRYWLDNVRYAEDDDHCAAFRSNEFNPRPYRDWVVKALNTDLPYDQFVRYQIAGDLLAKSSKAVDKRNDQLTATGIWGFPHILADNDYNRILADFVDQQLDVLGRTFMGLTLACARCHDHKFDPIRQRDYYAFAGIFFSSHSLSRVNPSTGKVQSGRGAFRVQLPFGNRSKKQLSEGRQAEKQIGKVRSELAFLKNVKEITTLLAQREAVATVQQKLAKAEKGSVLAKQLTERLVAERKKEAQILAAAEKKYTKKKFAELLAKYLSNTKLNKDLTAKIDAVQLRIVIREGGSPGGFMSNKIADVSVFVRGDHSKPGARAPREFPPAISWSGAGKLRLSNKESGRRELAQWLTHPMHPLTSRVMVNRIWQHLFGVGLVGSASNFGRLGEPPTHPELLDYLANEFVQSGWSVKQMIRRLVLSSTYRQASLADPRSLQIDPPNRLLSRMNRKRISAETLRDLFLELTGDLKRSAPVAKSGRSLYLLYSRVRVTNSLLAEFDGANTMLVVARRNESTAANQALFMLNNPFVLATVRKWSARLWSSERKTASRVVRAYREVYGRNPSAREVRQAVSILKRFAKQWAKTKKPQGDSQQLAWREFCHVLLCRNELMYLD